MTENERERLFRAFLAGWAAGIDDYERGPEGVAERDERLRGEFDLWVKNRGLAPVGG